MIDLAYEVLMYPLRLAATDYTRPDISENFLWVGQQQFFNIPAYWFSHIGFRTKLYKAKPGTSTNCLALSA